MSPSSERPSPPLPPPPVPPAPVAASPPLRDRNFVLLSWARAVSVLGNGFARVALAFAVLALPGSTPGQLSLVLACQLLPQVLFVLVGGVIADRIPRIRLMVAAELAGAAAYGGLAVMSLTGHAPPAALAVLAAAAGTATALFMPAVTAVVPEIVARERLTEANAALRMGMNVAMVLGLSLSGVVVAGVGAGWALALDALTFLASAGLIAGIRPARAHRRRGGPGLRDLRDGWREFAARQWLWVVVLQYAFVVAAQSAAVGVLGPLASEESSGGVREWSYVVAAQALGTIAGAGVAARLRPRRPILVAVLATFPAALPMVLLGVHAPVWPTVVAAFAAGVAGDVFGVLWATALQRDVPADALSRVSAYDWFGSLACAPLGMLAAGPLAAAAGPRTGLLCCAAVVVAATAAVLLSPQVRRFSA
ncbi:MFS transporter [Streptomyces roseoverticillatus]|uniref:MFS transporter n=1 Tax=Streptomyces roseoverticillatus TaxID=66429 RepID=UPI0033EFFE63